MKHVFITVALFFSFAMTASGAEFVARNDAKQISNYTTSWIGNTYGGLKNGKGQWVQQDIAAMCVTPDGTVYTNVPWEEAGGNCSMYKDGEMLGSAEHAHGWGFNGGKAVAVNDKYVYIALSGNNEGGGLVDPDTWPPKGKRWFGVSRRLRSDFTKGAPFEHGKGGQGDTLPKSFLVVNEVPDDKNADDQAAITGLWADNERLYVSNPLSNRIEIYDAETMRKLDAWQVPEKFQGKIRQIAVHPDGNLWMLVQRPREALLGDRFLVFDRNGKLFTQKVGSKTQHCPINIPENHEENFPHNYHPSAFCFDQEGRLLVADTGIWQTVFIFEQDGSDYVPTQNFLGWPMVGMRTGVFGDQMFRNITAIGCDAAGNVYVASDWATNGGGTVLESYRLADEPTVQAPPSLNHFRILPEAAEFLGRWQLNWRLFGLCFIDCATLDPDDETMAYTKEEQFQLDWSQEEPGKEATFLGATAFKPNPSFQTDARINNNNDFFRDPRLNLQDSASAWVRNLDGCKFLFVNDMSARFLQVYRLNFENERVPVMAVGLFSQQHYRLRNGDEPVVWLPNQPEKGEWIWRNRITAQSSQLFMNADEFTSREDNAPTIEGWWVDSHGDIWQATLRNGIRRLRFQGLEQFENPDLMGSPVWSFDQMDEFPHPEEFSQVKRIRYDTATDTLYLGGCATVDGVEHKNQHWKPMGPVIRRYDDFLRGDNPGSTEGKLRWKIVAPYVTGSSGHESCEPMGFDIAGDYMFVPYTGASKEFGVKTGHIEVFRLDDGSAVGWMEPDPATVGEIGLQDIRECLSAHRLANGEYVIFLEDDYKAKVVMFRWKP